jgi:hypothetical protein
MTGSHSIPDVLAERLPWRIERAEWTDPTLALGGPAFSLALTCSWRVRDRVGLVYSWQFSDVDERVQDLVGATVVRFEDLDVAFVDPAMVLDDGRRLELFSDTHLDPWVLHSGDDLVVVGDLEVGDWPWTAPGDVAPTWGFPRKVRWVDWSDDTLLLGGDDFNLRVACSWRILTRRGIGFSWSEGKPDDLAAYLVGATVLRVENVGGTPTDPWFVLSGERILQLFADSDVDEPWVLRAGDELIVGSSGP